MFWFNDWLVWYACDTKKRTPTLSKSSFVVSIIILRVSSAQSVLSDGQ